MPDNNSKTTFMGIHEHRCVHCGKTPSEAGIAKCEPIADACVWRSDESIGGYETACGEAFVFNDGGPHENRARFCMYCGKTIIVERGRGNVE